MRPTKLPGNLIDELSPFFPSLDLERIKIYTTIPRFIKFASRVTPSAITIGERIYFESNGRHGYDPHSIEGLELIAHELTHVEQFKRFSSRAAFGLRYIADYGNNRRRGMRPDDAYLNIKYEKEAVEKASAVVESIFKSRQKFEET